MLLKGKEYQTDAYQVYNWLSANLNEPGEGRAVNRNEGLHSQLRDQLNRRRREDEGVQQELADAGGFRCIGPLAAGLV